MGINFSPQDWKRIRRDHQAWWDGQLDRPLVYLVNVFEEGAARDWQGFGRFLPHFGPDKPAEEIAEAFEACQGRRHYLGDSYPNFFINFGAGIMAGFLGAQVKPQPETIWFEPQGGATLDNIDLAIDPENWWWKRVRDITRAAVDRFGDRVQITHTDLGGNLDILASLIGSESLLTELIDNPEKVLDASRQITWAWLWAFDELDRVIRARCPGTKSWAPVWAPGSTYMLQSDFSYMISPAMFNTFVMPDLRACCEHIEYPFYHLDGVGELPHLDQLLSLEKLRGIQWIPGAGKPEADQWPDVLRQIRSAGKLCQVSVNREGAKRICREHNGGMGFLLAIWDNMTPSQAEQFLDELRR